MRRGEVWSVDPDVAGKARGQGRRSVVVVSPEAFNEATGCPLVVPVSTDADPLRIPGFAVWLTQPGLRTEGFALCDQVRALDIVARGGRYVETVSDRAVDEIGARIAAILE